MNDLNFTGKPIEAREPAASQLSINRVVEWVKRNLFNSWFDSIITLLIILLLGTVLPKALDWLFFSATFSGAGRADCSPDAACWIPIRQYIDYYIYGPFPESEQWRVNSAFAVGLFAFPLLFTQRIPQKIVIGYILFLPVLLWVLLKGGFIFEDISTSALGGLTLTFFLGIIAMCLSLPVSILLALGRQTKLPILRWICVGYIELVRCIPVITFLFMASLVLQLFLPGGVSIDVLFRVLFVLIFVSAVYKAEIIRGAIQAVPKGQIEASYAMGCGYWKTMAYVVMPQALRNSVPALISNFIGLFKETTLVMILGLLEVMGAVKATFNNAEWLGLHAEGPIVVSAFFFVACFSIAQYGAYLERRIRRTKH
ncbi:amino acid ABC transporter permease [Marinomonas rhizomae]|uniref:General L-amino acid transport system permease protein n=1 Tax=Marinomonas rhizomae TaxID=491948 RepID=A0A366IX83_9GAMM|nr:amino acid ABC transporter permease [Marinomonas rhizomae]RBP79426.1 general L-amino acid transport system permease protein [Marinomonas rhizomae]RNF71354.1 amino acid ABC transporter permease [Marinomonas rhizomae]